MVSLLSHGGHFERGGAVVEYQVPVPKAGLAGGLLGSPAPCPWKADTTQHLF